jgi:hypothetical protein
VPTILKNTDTFVLKKNQEDLKSKLLSNEVLAVSTAGITQFNFPLFHGHKYCPSCVKEDLEKYGYGYWHIEHQIPGICSCYKHNLQLHGIAAGEHQLDKNLILPPKNMQILPASSGDNKFAYFSASLLESLQQPSVQFNYLQEYNVQLSNKGLLSNKGQLRNIKIVQELKEYWATLSTYSSNELSVSDALLKFEYIGVKSTIVVTHLSTYCLCAGFLTLTLTAYLKTHNMKRQYLIKKPLRKIVMKKS